MSDDFIPLNQSTPVQGRWQGRNQNQRFHNQSNDYKKKYQNGPRRGGNRFNSSQRNSSYGSDSNTSLGNDSRGNTDIDAYLHPAMLEDPWRHLYKNNS